MVGNSPKGPWGPSESKPEFSAYIEREALYKKFCDSVSASARNKEYGFDIEVEDDTRDIDALTVMYSAADPADWAKLLGTVDRVIAEQRSDSKTDTLASFRLERDDTKRTITVTVTPSQKS